jgi:hypothetical protein
MEERYFKVFHNRDYRWANELTVKTAFLTLLYNDTLFIMDSETETDRRYADLTMIIRPDKRHAAVFDVLIEFKFVSLKDAAMTEERAKKLSGNELENLPAIRKELADGKNRSKNMPKSLKKIWEFKVETVCGSILGV